MPSRTPKPPPPIAARRILLVDRNDMVLATLSAILVRDGFEVRTAGTADEAIPSIERETFDVLLTGLQLPRAVDGLSVLRAMRHANPGTFTMIFSGDPEKEMTAKALLLYADEIVSKPIPPAVLLSKIRSRMLPPAA